MTLRLRLQLLDDLLRLLKLRLHLLDAAGLVLLESEEPGAVLVAQCAEHLGDDFLRVQFLQGHRGELRHRVQADRQAVDAILRIGCPETHVDLGRQLRPQDLVGDLVHAELLRQLRLLAGHREHGLVVLVGLFQQQQLPNHRLDPGFHEHPDAEVDQ